LLQATLPGFFISTVYLTARVTTRYSWPGLYKLGVASPVMHKPGFSQVGTSVNIVRWNKDYTLWSLE